MNTIEIDSTYERVEIKSHKDLKERDVAIPFDATIGYVVKKIETQGPFRGKLLPIVGLRENGLEIVMNEEFLLPENGITVYRKKPTVLDHTAFAKWQKESEIVTCNYISLGPFWLGKLGTISVEESHSSKEIVLGKLAPGKEQQFADAVASMMDAIEGAE